MTPLTSISQQDMGHEVSAEGRRRGTPGPDDRRYLAPRRNGAGRARGRARALGRPVQRGAPGLQVPARRAHSRRRRHRAQRDPVQLLRHGHHPRRHVRHLRASEGSRAHHAAGRRHRLRLLDAAAQGRAGQGGGRRRIGTADVHGRVGCDVPDHHERRPPARRDDGDDGLRSPRYRGVHQGQADRRPAADVQSVGAGHRCVHAGAGPGRGLGPGIRRRVLQDRARARSVGHDHARDLRRGRAGRDLHRPHQPTEPAGLLRDDHRDQPVRRAAIAALWRMPAGLDQPGTPGSRAVHRGRAARSGGA